MDRTRWPSICGLVLGTIVLTRQLSTTFAFDKPVLSSIVSLFTLSAAVIGASRLLPRDTGRVDRGQQYESVPLEDVGDLAHSQHPSVSSQHVQYPSSLRKLRILFLILVCALSLRVELLRRIAQRTECTGMSWDPLIPFAFAIWDFWTIQRHKKRIEHDDDPNSNVYDNLEQRLIATPYRYVVPIGLISLSSLVSLSLAASPRSTYICAATSSYSWLVPLLQKFATVLDLILAYCISQLLHLSDGRSARSLELRFISVGWAFLFTAVLISMAGVLHYTAFATVQGRKRILEIPRIFVSSLFTLNLSLIFFVLCGLLSVLHVGLMSTSVLVTFTTVITITTSYTWLNSFAFPPTSGTLGFMALCITLFAFATYVHVQVQADSHHSAKSHTMFGITPSWIYTLLLGLFFVRTCLWAYHSSSVSYHPIDMLIFEAKTAHETYLNRSSTSRTLQDAVTMYHRKYDRSPPPGFQHWYNYATARNAVVIDEFDSIHDDLLPFHSLSPEEIRLRTWKLMANSWHDASGLSIRNGKVDISPNVMPTHRWMLDGTVSMISNFAEWLPDMDLAFNVNDECRIAVPFQVIDKIRQEARDSARVDPVAKNTFSEGRAEQWSPLPEKSNEERVMIEKSWQHTFYPFGSIGCPPDSSARKQRYWDKSELCLQCIEPHSMGAFLSNWTSAADICQQPDMANLHGIYLSPAAFKATDQLYPIFSQSKVHGFNDILYPSAWNYLDKAKYAPSEEFPDPPFAEKNASLFWRGATSEGVSSGKGQWQGMTRQRLVHLTNGMNGTNPPQSILLPYNVSRDQQRLAYAQVPISELEKLIPTDVRIAENIVRCGGDDCPGQEAEFWPLVDRTDFQIHWQHKYLLDLDGAGFSGRFLPFLQSRSLPFKTAVFREWWDDRVTAWQHFVPLDVRGHGLWATLTYFAGLKGQINARHVSLEPHEIEAERIAKNGREWAETVLRKEDMEIYFFRLLLEWGRLTDDHRDNIGYSLESG